VSGYSVYLLKDAKRPQVGDTAATNGGDSDSSDGVADLIDNTTNPARVADAGTCYVTVAEMCGESVETLYRQAQRISESLGGDALEGVFKKIGELQNDLAQVDQAAQTVGRPLVWYGQQVLPWFRNNVPRTGDVDVDDDIGDFFGTDGNAHALARHHLEQLNRFMGEVHDRIQPELEQRATPPAGGAGIDPHLPGVSGVGPLGGVPDPYSSGGFDSPYTGPDLPDLNDPSGSGLDTPGPGDLGSGGTSAQDPSLQDPSTQDPSLKDPSLQDPSTQNPSTQNPDVPGLDQPPPDLSSPDLNNPDLKTPDLPKTDLSGLPNTLTGNPNLTNIPNNLNTGIPSTGPQSPSGIGSATVAQGAGGGGSGGGAGRAAAGGMPMGMFPPGMGGGGGQDQDRERTRFPLLEDAAFESEDLGGPAVIA
jgi:hypothetical protein